MNLNKETIKADKSLKSTEETLYKLASNENELVRLAVAVNSLSTKPNLDIFVKNYF